MVPINYVAVLACAVVATVLGFLWYGALFGKQWMAIMGWTPEKMAEMRKDPKMKSGMMRSYTITILGALLMAFAMAHSIVFASAYLKISGVSAGLQAALLSWLGFVAPATIGGVLWEQKPWKWWCILAGYYLVSLLVMGVILGMWM